MNNNNTDKNKTIWFIRQYASTPKTGNSGRHHYLAQELSKKGYNVYVICASYNHLLTTPPTLTTRYKTERIDGYTHVWVKVPRYKNAHSKKRIMNWFIFTWRLFFIYKHIADKPDIVLCSSPSPIPFIAAKKIADRFKAKIFFEVRDIWPLTLIKIGNISKNNPIIKILQWAENKAYKESYGVTSNLLGSVQHMVEHGLKEEKFTWIPNGYSPQVVNNPESLSESVEDKIPRNKFIVGYTGTVGLANSLITLVEAAIKLKGNNKIYFIVVGNGRERENLKQIAKDNHLQNILFIDRIPKNQVQSMIKKFDVCYIGWLNNDLYKYGIAANKIYDYLYSGKPIIHSYSGDYDPIMKANAGMTIEAENSNLLANTILKFYEMSKKELDQLGENGRSEAILNYNYEKIAEKLEYALFYK